MTIIQKMRDWLDRNTGYYPHQNSEIEIFMESWSDFNKLTGSGNISHPSHLWDIEAGQVIKDYREYDS